MVPNLKLVTTPEDDADPAVRDRRLIARMRSGDADALDHLFLVYRDDLGGFAESIVRSREAAEEILQDLFFRLWEQREGFSYDGPLRPYLFRAVRNRAISHLRGDQVAARLHERLTRQAVVDADRSRPVSADDMVEVRDLAAAIGRVVANLPPRCQEVFRLSRYHHLSHADVAAVMGIAPKTVEAQLRRALIVLRRELAPHRDPNRGRQPKDDAN